MGVAWGGGGGSGGGGRGGGESQDGFTPLRLAHHGEHTGVIDAILEKEAEGDLVTLEEEWGRLARRLLFHRRSDWFQSRQEGATSDLMQAGTLTRREHMGRVASCFPMKMLYYRALQRRFGRGRFFELQLLDMSPELREAVREQARASLNAGGGYRAEGCASCGASKVAGMMRCKRCADRGVVVHYCNAACQRTHWPVHKADCRV